MWIPFFFVLQYTYIRWHILRSMTMTLATEFVISHGAFSIQGSLPLPKQKERNNHQMMTSSASIYLLVYLHYLFVTKPAHCWVKTMLNAHSEYTAQKSTEIFLKLIVSEICFSVPYNWSIYEETEAWCWICVLRVVFSVFKPIVAFWIFWDFLKRESI